MHRLKTPFVIALILVAAALGLTAAGFTQTQTLASVIFLMIICGTLFYWKFRLAFALAGIAGEDLPKVFNIFEQFSSLRLDERPLLSDSYGRISQNRRLER